MTSVTQVLQRINNIERRFQSNVGSVNFAAVLNQAGKKGDNKVQNFQQPDKSNISGIIQHAARKYGVDPALALAVAQTESDLVPDVVSSAGAAGVMQLMPATARALGVRNVFDPRENIDGGVRYLKQMLDMFGGDAARAVAAYNAGPQAVKDYNGIPPFPETRAYVNKVLSLSR